MNRRLLIIMLLPFFSFGQQYLQGEIANSTDVESIHVFNKTYSKYTITDKKGKFKIEARINDTLVFSALQYELKQLVVTKKILKKYQYVLLKTKISELDAVYIMPKLSGNLLSDTKNIHTKKALTAKTLGLPNAHVIPPTPAERKVYTATHGGGLIPVDAIINAITGRTKMLKQLVKWEKKTNLEENVHVNFENVIHNEFKIPEDKIYDFIFYTSRDEIFSQIIKTNSSMIIYEFLKTKATAYLKLQK